MDRRQRKTRAAIFSAFTDLLEIKRYTGITVQDIIDKANIGRSTFYSHFQTKDELLKTMCSEIFDHVFSNELLKEDTHDFSGESKVFSDKITHILYHLRDKERQIKSILSCESGELFMRYFKEYLIKVFEDYINLTSFNVPQEYILNYMASSFAETVRWWIREKSEYTPEDIALFYLTMQAVKID